MASVQKLLLRLTKADKKISTVIDLTEQYNTNHSVYQDVGGWDVAVVQVIDNSGSIYFQTTNDDGSVTGQLLPAPEVPINWYDLRGLDITNNDSVNYMGNGLVKFTKFGKYIKFATTYSFLPYIDNSSSESLVICYNPISSALYYNYGIVDLEIGITLYRDPELSNPYTPDCWTKIAWQGNPTIYDTIFVDNFGVIQDLDTCPPIMSTITSGDWGDECPACANIGTASVTVYSDKQYITPTIGIGFYTDAGLTIPFVTSPGWYTISWGGYGNPYKNVIQLDIDSLISNTGLCSSDCPANAYDYVISAIDLGLAVGNTDTALNGKVYAITADDGSGNPASRVFTSAGIYNHWLCSNVSIVPTLGYYAANVFVTSGLISEQILDGSCF